MGGKRHDFPSKRKNRGAHLKQWRNAKKNKSAPVESASESAAASSADPQQDERPATAEEDPPTDNLVYDLTPPSDLYKAIQLTGRRTVSIGYFTNEIQRLNVHDKLGFGCNFNDMVCINETRLGVGSRYNYRCKVCNHEESIHTEDPNDPRMNANTGAVAGVLSTGGGYANLQTMNLNLNMPTMSETTFRRYQERVADLWHATALEAMYEGVQEEISFTNRKDQFNCPLLTVVVDGAYGKRSYRTNFKSLYGVVSVNLL